MTGDVGLVPKFPFTHAFTRLDRIIERSPFDAAQETFDRYGAMLRHVGMGAPALSNAARQSMPYCLLVARDWMLLVPRSREHVEGISLNSLAYAGSFFVQNEEELSRLRSRGPIAALAAAGVARI